MFLRGDHDVAAFQKFKEVEVAVRPTVNAEGANYTDDPLGVALRRKAFHSAIGPLIHDVRVAALARWRAEGRAQRGLSRRTAYGGGGARAADGVGAVAGAGGGAGLHGP
jgi:hypothetical protein